MALHMSSGYTLTLCFTAAEVVICLLVEALRFSPSKHEIIWQMNPIATPTTKGNDSLVPVLPLVVERI